VATPGRLWELMSD
jgi:ATP-dependent RNA helicase DDX24/MAK5